MIFSGFFLDEYSRCKWSSSTGELLLFVKYDDVLLNILDVEKKTLTLTFPIALQDKSNFS